MNFGVKGRKSAGGRSRVASGGRGTEPQPVACTPAPEDKKSENWSTNEEVNFVKAQNMGCPTQVDPDPHTKELEMAWVRILDKDRRSVPLSSEEWAIFDYMVLGWERPSR